VAVGLALEQRRPRPGTRPVDRLEPGLAHRPEVVPIDDLRLHAEGRGPDADLAARGDARHRRELAVEVVLADVHDRQVEHLRPVEALVEVTLVRGAVAKEGGGDAPLALRGHRGPGGGGDAAAHDAEAADEAMLEVDHVHRSCPPATDPGRAPEHLRHERLRVRALRKRVAVAAVGAGDVVVRLERRADADRNGFLAGRQVRRAVNLALQEQAVNLLLKAPDQAHPAVALKVFGG
jgi:hypothetical protein